MMLGFDEITFEAAHYIPGHETCGGIHGHTYRVKDVQIEMTGMDSVVRKYGMFVDFKVIKGYFKEHWDHKFIVPNAHISTWNEVWPVLKEVLKLDYNLVGLKFTTCEWMAAIIQQQLISVISTSLPERMAVEPVVRFALYEGDNSHVIV